MYLVVQGNIKQYHEPKLFYTSKVASFIKDVLGMELKHFTLKLESWVVGNFDSASTDGLDDIVATLNPAPKKRVMMNYNNYEQEIVETYSIALYGFPLGTVQNPGKIGCRTSCSWVKLTDSKHTECMKNNLECQAKGE
ncbi:hypothetical protein BDR03DRAFT_985086 [Suillus americanus]|nr:hypothetical protein BDR03DRAFT_985086 [Suillus americanus]